MKDSSIRYQEDQEIYAFPFLPKKPKIIFNNSVYITAPLVALIVTQEETLPINEILSQRIATIKRNNSNQKFIELNSNFHQI